MISNILTVGDRIEMKRLAAEENSENKPRIYASQLNDIIDDSTLDVAIPMEGSRLVLYEVGTRVELRFITTGGIYLCKAQISQRCRQGMRTFYIIKILSELRKDQRRQYFRLDKIMEISYHKATVEEMEIMTRIRDKQYKDEYEMRAMLGYLAELKITDSTGTLINISGGGLKFNSSEPLEKDMLIRLKILLEGVDILPLDLFARVISSEKSRNQSLTYEHRAEFVNINRDTREKIVKYIFNEDRKLRRRINPNT
ncbi:MAG: flagellar brake protein [Lachnospiraceae bacterium]|nr:flagellar brake protein [Lachnospiraceae bacterium]MBP5653452.1 flagellar brake protein [Lachnospiraceae bacterium]